MEQEDVSLLEALAEIEEASQTADEWVHDKVTEVSGGLTLLLDEIIERRENGEILTEDELQRYIMDLAGFIYVVNSKAEILGIRIDTAERARARTYAKAFKAAAGGREAKAEEGTLAAMTYQSVKETVNRAYWLIRRQVDSALEMINTLKKSLGYRAEELQVFQREVSGKYQGRIPGE